MNPSTLSSSLRAPAGDSEPGGGAAGTGTMAQAKQAIKRTASNAASSLKAAAADTSTKVKDQAGRIAGEKRDTVASKLDEYTAGLHESARAFEQKDPNIAYFTQRAADRLQGVADYVRTRDFVSLRSDAEGIARQHPAAFFGGMFIAGLILGNVLKSGRRPESDGSEWEPERQTDFDPAENDTLGFPAEGSATPTPGA
jgi:hypothetical protein